MICNYNSRCFFIDMHLYVFNCININIYIYIYNIQIFTIIFYKESPKDRSGFIYLHCFLAHLDLNESPPGCQQVAVARWQPWMENRTCKHRPNALLHRSCSCNPHLESLALSGAFSKRTEAHWAHFLQVPLEVLHLHPEPVVLDGKVLD